MAVMWHQKYRNFWEHFALLRLTLLWMLVVFILTCALTLYCLPLAADWLNRPLLQAFKLAGVQSDGLKGLVTTSPMGIFSVLMNVCFVGGFLLALPLHLILLGHFLAPALTPREKKFIFYLAFAALALFLAGVILGYCLVLPGSLLVAIKLNEMMGFTLVWSATDYYQLVVWMSLSLGALMEFPLILWALISGGLLRVETLRRLRRVAFVTFLCIAALINPSGDPISMLCLGGLMQALYELVIWLGARQKSAYLIQCEGV